MYDCIAGFMGHIAVFGPWLYRSVTEGWWISCLDASHEWQLYELLTCAPSYNILSRFIHAVFKVSKFDKI